MYYCILFFPLLEYLLQMFLLLFKHCYCNKTCSHVEIVKCDIISAPINFTLIFILLSSRHLIQYSATLTLYPHRDHLSFFLSNLRIKHLNLVRVSLPSDVNKLFISQCVSEILEALSAFLSECFCSLPFTPQFESHRL